MEKRSLLLSGTVLYLILPLLFFAYGWLRQPAASVTFIVLFVFLLTVIRDFYFLISRFASTLMDIKNRVVLKNSTQMWGFPMFVISVWVFLSGVGGFGFQTVDYLASNALFKDLIELPWPLTTQWNGESVNIVYYVGWYLPAAWMGKLFGWSAANVFLLVWSLVGLVLSFGWFWKATGIHTPSVGRLLLTVTVFCLAGGLDFFGYFLLRAQPLVVQNLVNVEAWTFLQYSSNSTLIYWVPQHTIPAWLITGLVMDCIYGEAQGVRYLGIGLTGCLIASPFGVVGVLPYLPFFLATIWFQRRWQDLFSRQSFIFNGLALPVAIPVILFLSSNKFSFPAGFLWEFSDNPLIYAGWFEFCLMEFGILATFVFVGIWLDKTTHVRKLPLARKSFENYLNERHGFKREQFALFVVSVIVLSLLPVFKMGYSNDFVMRGSISSLFIFWSFISKIFLDSGFSRYVELRFPYLVIVSLLVVGFYNSLAQISESIHKYHFGPPDRHTILSVGTANAPLVVEQRIGKDDTFFYRYLGK